MAELTIRPDDIRDALQQFVSDYKPEATTEEIGTVAEAMDGIARVEGLPSTMANELLEFEDGTLGLALNLDVREIGVVILGEFSGIEEGQKVVLGLLGARYLDQHSDPPRWSRLKPAKIRGVQTEGMVMSEAELAISEEHEGIIVLDPATPLGLPAREVLGDVILQIDVTPNNGRVLSMIGLAREIKAIFGGELRYPDTSWEPAGSPIEGLLDIEIDDPDLCGRYTGGVIQGVRLGQSPGWMQRRITLAGMRPVSNIVDDYALRYPNE